MIIDKNNSDLLVDFTYKEKNAQEELRFIKKQKEDLCNKLKITIGDWNCPDSPINVCIYKDEDYYQDYCIYCGQPDERK